MFVTSTDLPVLLHCEYASRMASPRRLPKPVKPVAACLEMKYVSLPIWTTPELDAHALRRTVTSAAAMAFFTMHPLVTCKNV